MLYQVYTSIVAFIAPGATSERFKKYSINTAWLFGLKLFTLGVSFLVGAYIARYLGPTEFGLMSYVMSFVGIFAVISTLGVDEILKRELVKRNEERHALMSTSFWIKAIGSFTTILVIISISYCLYGLSEAHILIIIYSLTFLFQSFDVFDIFFQSQVEAKRGVTVRLGIAIIGALIKILGIWLGAGITWFLWTYVAEAAATGIGLWLNYRQHYESFIPHHGTKSLAKELLGASWPLMFSGIAITLYMKVDQVFIGNLLSITSVGVYAIAVKISELWYTIPVVLCASVSPALVRARLNDKVLYKKYLSRLYFSLFWIGFFIALGITIFAHQIVNILFGYKYLEAVPVLRLYVWGGLGVFLGVALALYLTIENQTRVFFFTTLCGGVSNILLNLVLIPRFGIMGSAAATVISYSLVVISIAFFSKTREHAFFMLSSVVSWR